MKRGINRNNSKVFIKPFVFIFIVFGLIFLFFYSTEFVFNGMTGKSVYNQQLTMDSIKSSVQLNKGFKIQFTYHLPAFNKIIWPIDINTELKVEDAFESIIVNIYYVYNYNEKKYWFNPKEKYERYSNSILFKKRLFDKLKSGNTYSIQMKQDDILIVSCIPYYSEEKEILEGNSDNINGLNIEVVIIDENNGNPYVFFNIEDDPFFSNKELVQQVIIGNRDYTIDLVSVENNKAKIKITECLSNA